MMMMKLTSTSFFSFSPLIIIIVVWACDEMKLSGGSCSSSASLNHHNTIIIPWKLNSRNETVFYSLQCYILSVRSFLSVGGSCDDGDGGIGSSSAAGGCCFGGVIHVDSGGGGRMFLFVLDVFPTVISPFLPEWYLEKREKATLQIIIFFLPRCFPSSYSIFSLREERKKTEGKDEWLWKI